MRKLFTVAFLFFIPVICFSQTTLSGVVKDSATQEVLIGVSVIQSNSTSVATNKYGFFSIQIPSTNSVLTFSMVGYKELSRTIPANENGSVVLLAPQITEFDEVVVNARRDFRQKQIGLTAIAAQDIKNLPTLGGEKDLMKVIQLLPGIQKGSDGNASLYVRGGAADQNLILLDEAPVYNANHLFGFFSVFNGDAIKSVNFYKGSFPARYGGRISSIIDIQTKDGNRTEFEGEAGIGLISSRLTLQGPVKKNKSSFIVSGRRNYLDLVSKPILRQSQLRDFGYYFYDLNAKYNVDISKKSKLIVSGYFGKDNYYNNARKGNTNGADDYDLNWQNQTITARLNTVLNKNTFSNLTFYYTRYKLYALREKGVENSVFFRQAGFESKVNDVAVKYDVDYFAGQKHQLSFGAEVIAHNFKPNTARFQDALTNQQTITGDTLRSFEAAIYAGEVYRPTDKLTITAGLRFSNYNISSTSYFRPEPRIMFTYDLNSTSKIQASYTVMNQYVHLIGNSGLSFPTDYWLPSTELIKPQRGEQWSAGYIKRFAKVDFTAEVFYKKMSNVLNYLPGASFTTASVSVVSIGRTPWQEALTQGRGLSYGAEFLIKKEEGKLTGWVAYTLAKATQQYDLINEGKTFFARFDRRHDVSIVANYRFSQKFRFAATWILATGSPIAIPQATIDIPLQQPVTERVGNIPIPEKRNKLVDYGLRDSFRMQDYHRLDLGVHYFLKNKKRKERYFDLSIFNAYGRLNPLYYFIDAQTLPSTGESREVLKKFSLFSVVPSLTYNVKF